MSAGRPTQTELIYSYYRERAGEAVPHAEAVDWAVREWSKRTGGVFRDPDRAIRKLHQEGKLIKDGKGLYRYERGLDGGRALRPFTAGQKQEIFARDGYRCVICGAGPANGFELHADHVKPIDRGGESTLENGQTLCSLHNMRKKNLGQTETGKKMFIRLYQAAQASGDDELCAFIRDVLLTYEAHGINSHIVWRSPQRSGRPEHAGPSR